jgi:hypothetical protein
MVELISAEFLLSRVGCANGGDIILARSLWGASIVYALLLGVKHWCETGALIGPHRGAAFGQYVGPTIPWFGAMFAGIYATLQARYSSQWTYLAGVYNRIKEAALKPGFDASSMAEWKAGFIEDAQDLHLIGKPMFQTLFRAWATEDVEASFKAHTENGEVRWATLMAQFPPKMTAPAAPPNAPKAGG